jgi:DNA transformation protein
MASVPAPFAHYCCELLASAGPCVAKRMFGGWGISIDGLTLAIVADLGDGEKLWLKASDATRPQWEASGCARFTYTSTKDGQSVARGMNYYSAPEEAMDSPHAMAPWARLAMDAALAARAPAKAPRKAPSAAPRTTATASKARKAATAPKKP